MYIDYGGFGESYFEGGSDATPHPAGYSDYRRAMLPFDHYADMMASIIQNYGVDPANGKVLIVGCAYGYTVQWLRDQYGTEAWGMDASQYAVTQAATEITDDVVRLGDVRNSNDLKSVRQESPGGRFDVIFTECVLECLTDAEAQTAAANCRSAAQQRAGHRVWTADGSDVNPDYYNNKTLAEWQALVDPDGADDWYHEDDFQP